MMYGVVWIMIWKSWKAKNFVSSKKISKNDIYILNHLRNDSHHSLCYWVRMWENTDQKKLRIWTLFKQWSLCCLLSILLRQLHLVLLNSFGFCSVASFIGNFKFSMVAIDTLKWYTLFSFFCLVRYFMVMLAVEFGFLLCWFSSKHRITLQKVGICPTIGANISLST